MKKLYKLLKLLKLIKQIRYALRGRGRGYGPGYGQGYGPGYHIPRGDHWHPRSRGYHPLYRRSKKPKLKHMVRELLAHRRY